MEHLTNSQQEAIKSRDLFVAITAGAGSGKTRVIIERTLYLIANKLTGIGDILVITFTEAAAAELASRLAGVVADELSLATANIGTFHAFCAKILREHAPLIGIDPDFEVMEAHTSDILIMKAVRETLIDLIEKDEWSARTAIEELEFKNVVACLEDLMKYRWHACKLIPVDNPSTREDGLKNAVLQLFQETNKRYDLLKGINLDFQDLEIFAIKLLNIDDIRNRLQRRFKYILVDEYQDINDTQGELIRLIFSSKANHLTIVGDAKQSIYRFRGANVHEFENVLKSAGHVIKLRENFRSDDGIINLVNRAFPEFEPLVATKKSGPSVRTLYIEAGGSAKVEDRRVKEADAIAKIIPTLEGHTACLFSTLNDVSIYTQALASHGIDYAINGGSTFLERRDVTDIINALRVVSDHKDVVALIGLARSPLVGLSDEELFLICCDCPDKSALYDKIKAHKKAELLPRLEELSPHLSISELICEIAGDIFSDNVQKLCQIASAAERREKITLTDFVDYLKILKDRDAPISEFPATGDEGLILMTIHQAKGLEFDNVILPDLIREPNKRGRRWLFVRGHAGLALAPSGAGLAFKLVPAENPQADAVPTDNYNKISGIDSAEEILERERLLYVAMTRAKRQLVIPLHNDLKGKRHWHDKLKNILQRD